MTPEQLEEIEARARGATPGPWSRQSGCVPQVVIGPHSRQLLRCYKDQIKGTDPVANAAHIAGMDPATTLALTAALREAWEALRLGKIVMDLLEEHGASIVPHILDSDENAGERFRQAIARAALKEPTHD